MTLSAEERKGEIKMTKEVKKMLSLNIQMFAEDSNNEEESKKDETKENNDKKTDEGEKKAQESVKTYTDDDVNSISMKNERKAVRDALKRLGYKVPVNATKEEMDAIIEGASNKEAKEDTTKNSTEEIAKESEKHNKYINAELKIALLQANIKKEKIDRAINLIDKSKVLDDGEIDPDKLAEEIESLTKEWSELLDTKKEDDSSVGFVIGSDGKQEKKTNALEDIERVMGIKK